MISCVVLPVSKTALFTHGGMFWKGSVSKTTLFTHGGVFWRASVSRMAPFTHGSVFWRGSVSKMALLTHGGQVWGCPGGGLLEAESQAGFEADHEGLLCVDVLGLVAAEVVPRAGIQVQAQIVGKA